MCAWNLFTQATLYKHPRLQFLLTAYQKEFCHLVRHFKFEACYSYDKAQRKNIASQNNMPALSRTVSWDKRNKELYNIFLRVLAAYPRVTIATPDHIMHLRSHKNDHTHNQVQWPHNPNAPDGKQTQQQWTKTDSPILTPTDLTETPTSICFRYNNSRYCNKPPCNFQHNVSNATKIILQSIASTQLIPLFVHNVTPLPEQITTQININNMQECPIQYPDRYKVDYVLMD